MKIAEPEFDFSSRVHQVDELVFENRACLFPHLLSFNPTVLFFGFVFFRFVPLQ
jgi:hypothetical protein